MADVETILKIKKRSPHDLIELAKQEFGDWKENGKEIRFYTCPLCGESHPDNPAFAVDKEGALFNCFSCSKGGHLSQLLKYGEKTPQRKSPGVLDQTTLSEEEQGKIQYAQQLYEASSVAARGGITDLYLSARSIIHNSWADLDLPLKETDSPLEKGIAVYPFKNQSGNLVAIQRVLWDSETKSKVGRRYLGKKSLGVSILKDAKEVIVAEGLETGLSVRQHLGNSYGLIIAGDAGNLESLAESNSWAVKHRKTIIIAADNNKDNTGIKAARAVFQRFHKKTLIFMPSRPDHDWNDLLIQKKIHLEWI